MSTDAGVVRVERRDATVVITFDRPGARNAMTWAMYGQLDRALDRVASEPDVRVAVLRGAGGNFIAGTDITQFTSFTTGDDGVAYERRLEAVLAKLESLPVATIAALEGYVVGGGLALAAACDVRVCTPDARFGVPIAKTVGNCLSMANYARLASLVGPQRVKEMLLLARLVDAPSALQAGLVMEVLADTAALQARAQQIAETLAGHAPITLSTTKEAMRRLQAKLADENIDDLIRHTYGSADFREGMSAFLEKRPPKWAGE